MNRIQYPFAALVGQELMKTALILNAVDPSIGGVLIRGQKGTGKTSAVRALRDLLPPIRVVRGCPRRCDPDEPDTLCSDCAAVLARGGTPETEEIPTPLVDLPLNATEDRLVGSLQVEETLRTGERRFEPGLLAAAHRGILYIDEVNLLEDHLVDLLLDAAATGVNVVEREGISLSHPASFMLVGTMNPEEGELRPQFLDRFGLCVTVSGLAGVEERLEILRRRTAFERDPEAFSALWEGENRALARQILRGRKGLSRVERPEEVFLLAARTAADAGAAGHRGEIGMLKAASALAAFTESRRVLPFHMCEAARLVLPHRMNHLPDMDQAQGRIDAVFREVSTGGGRDPALADLDEGASAFPGGQVPEEYTEEYGLDTTAMEEMQVPGAMAAGSILFTFLKKKLLTMKAPPTR